MEESCMDKWAECQVECAKCGLSSRLSLLPHRNSPRGRIVGFLFVCPTCLPEMAGASLQFIDADKERA